MYLILETLKHHTKCSKHLRVTLGNVKVNNFVNIDDTLSSIYSSCYDYWSGVLDRDLVV